MMDNVKRRADRRARARQTMAAMRRDRLDHFARQVQPGCWVLRDTCTVAQNAAEAFNMLRAAIAGATR